MQKKDLFRFYISLALAVIGIFAIFSPQYAMFAVVIILGIILTLWGLVSVIQYFNQKNNGQKPSGRILLAFVLLIIGILLLSFSGQAKSVFIPVIIGFWALAAGVFATINAVSFYKRRQDYLLSVIALIVSFATAIAMFAFSSSINGFSSSGGGVFLLIFGIVTAMEITVSGRRKNA
jgi:uncharacterized membrane protein HdeD (DUF308 family)